MKYFKNSDICRLYNVSDKAVRNWLEAAYTNSINLELHQEDGKLFVADTLSNCQVLESLARRAKKYRNKKTHRNIKPLPEFYNLYNRRQIIDIVRSLDTQREYPQHYRYSGKGADYWNTYLEKLSSAGNDNYLACTKELIKTNWAYLQALLANHSTVNVVDLGVGNGYAAYDIIDALILDNKMGSYTGIDISRDLLNKTEGNLVKRYSSDRFKISKHVHDITYERFGDLLLKNDNEVNLVLFLGGTITNFRDPNQPLQTIYDSLTREDILLSTLKLDNDKSRRFFDFNIDSDRSPLPLHDRYVLDMLGIDESMYAIEQFFSPEHKARYIRVRLKFDLTIVFEMPRFSRKVEVEKNETILLWRALHFSDTDISKVYKENFFDILHTSKSMNREYFFLASRVTPYASSI